MVRRAKDDDSEFASVADQGAIVPNRHRRLPTMTEGTKQDGSSQPTEEFIGALLAALG